MDIEYVERSKQLYIHVKQPGTYPAGLRTETIEDGPPRIRIAIDRNDDIVGIWIDGIEGPKLVRMG